MAPFSYRCHQGQPLRTTALALTLPGTLKPSPLTTPSPTHPSKPIIRAAFSKILPLAQEF